MAVKEHTVSYRNGPQVMVAGLKLKDLGYKRGCSVTVSDPSGNAANTVWRFVVSNDEHSTLVSKNPAPPDWIQTGILIRIEVEPSAEELVQQQTRQPTALLELANSPGAAAPTSSFFNSSFDTVPSGGPAFRGNLGNLLQHWVLCEILSACQNHYDRLGFFDAYSMAPFASQRPKRDATSHLFDAVSTRLPGEQSLYERAWLRLVPSAHEYPNSAAFVTAVWRGRYAMLLCDSDSETVSQLERWATVARHFPGCEGIEIASGDWRQHLRGAVLTSSDLTFLSFDPYMFDRRGSGRNPGHMAPPDLDELAQVVNGIPSSVVVQLSTYSANNDNAQRDVRAVVTSRLETAGLDTVAVIRADGSMMSMVFIRDVEGAEVMRSMPSRFEVWLEASRSRSKL